MTTECKNFIELCLKKHPSERLGSTNDIEEILGHPWFADVDIEALKKKQLDPEFKPKLTKNLLDVSNFDKMFTSDEAIHSVLPLNTQKKIAKQKDKFKGFDA